MSWFRRNWAALDDADLIQAVAEDSEEAFKELLNRYQRQIHNFAWRFLRDPEEARDVAQETFLRICRAAGTFRRGGSPRAYLFRIARNLCIDRERKMRPELMGNLPEPVEEKTPLELLREKEKLDALAEAVKALPENQRSAVILRHTEGMSYSEIADVMSLTVPAVESLLVRGRRTLKNRLAGFGGD